MIGVQNLALRLKFEALQNGVDARGDIGHKVEVLGVGLYEGGHLLQGGVVHGPVVDSVEFVGVFVHPVNQIVSAKKSFLGAKILNGG